MKQHSRPFRYERLEELPSTLPFGGFRVLRRRAEPGGVYFDCRSAGGVEMSFQVTPQDGEGLAEFSWGTDKGCFAEAIATVAAAPLLALLEVRGFFEA